MTDTENILKGKTQEELLEVQRNSEVGSSIHQAATLDIQRIQQDTNNNQVATLIGQVGKLKDITDKSANSANTLSKIVIVIATATLLIQVILFLVSDFQKNKDTYDTILGLNSYNCALATTTVQVLLKTPDAILTRQFLTTEYSQYLGYIHERFGTQGLGTYASSVSSLDAVNEEIALTLTTSELLFTSEGQNSAVNFETNSNLHIRQDVSSFYETYCAKGALPN